MRTPKQEVAQTLSCTSQERASKVIQIHPTLRCNLACKHCYSNSAPNYRNYLDVKQLNIFLTQFINMGYNVISLSGGEPFVYQSLSELLQFSKSIGFFNSITTNAMLLGSVKAQSTLKYADLVAVSIDGEPKQHDFVRDFQGAFKKTFDGLKIVKDNVANYGFIHTILPQKWQVMVWLAEFAHEHKAKLLQFHPLEMSGRAKHAFQDVIFTSIELHKIYILHNYLQEKYKNDFFIQLDLLHRDNIIENPNFIFHQRTIPSLESENFATIFKELIINENGDIMPIAHGCSQYFKIGNIYDTEPFEIMVEKFMENRMQDIVCLYNSVHQRILEDIELELVNWSELIIEKSYDFSELALI